MELEGVFQQLEFVLRLLIAGICGAFVGYERNNRLKEAGIRTHLIVSLASCLMMIISKYGFFDILGGAVKLDPSRVAAGIVTGVGFLGAGMIFVRKTGQSVRGLTTSAGIWATVGIGMAIGGGMYFVGIISTVIIIFAQIILHKNLHFLKMPVGEQIIIQTKNNSDAISYIQKTFEENHIEIVNMKAEKVDSALLELEIYAKFNEPYRPEKIMNLFKDDPNILSIEV